MAAGERVFWRAYRQFNDDLGQLYQDPAAARAAILRVAARDPERVAAEIRTSPDRFGTLSAAEGGVREGRAAAAGESATVFLRARADRPRTTLKVLRERLAERAEAVRQARAHPDAVQANGLAKMELRFAQGRRDYYFRAMEGARKRLGRTYADPAKAGRTIWHAVQREGRVAVEKEIREHPERFGALRGEERRRLFGVRREVDTSAARTSAADTVRAVGIAAEAREQAPTRKELAELRSRVASTQRDLDAARAAGPPRRLPQQIDLEIAALMQKAAAQAQRVGTGTLGPGCSRAPAAPQQDGGQARPATRHDGEGAAARRRESCVGAGGETHPRRPGAGPRRALSRCIPTGILSEPLRATTRRVTPHCSPRRSLLYSGRNAG